jgi:hypothetical protein
MSAFRMCRGEVSVDATETETNLGRPSPLTTHRGETRMFLARKSGLRGLLLATVIASSVALAPSASAADEVFNDARLTIRGGDATGGDAVAVAACLNVLYGSGSVEQENDCENNAIATGGNVTVTIQVAGIGGVQGFPVMASRSAVRTSSRCLRTVEMYPRIRSQAWAPVAAR